MGRLTRTGFGKRVCPRNSNFDVIICCCVETLMVRYYLGVCECTLVSVCVWGGGGGGGGGGEGEREREQKYSHYKCHKLSNLQCAINTYYSYKKHTKKNNIHKIQTQPL